MSTPNQLSQAAQAVIDAAYALPLRNGQPSIADAFKAVADQVVPEPRLWPCWFYYNRGAEDRQNFIRFRLLCIADELEQHFELTSTETP